MKKVVNKIFITFSMLLLVIGLFGVVKAFALATAFKITNVEVKEKTDGNPDTRDNIYIYVIILVISTAGLIITIGKNKKVLRMI